MYLFSFNIQLMYTGKNERRKQKVQKFFIKKKIRPASKMQNGFLSSVLTAKRLGIYQQTEDDHQRNQRRLPPAVTFQIHGRQSRCAENKNHAGASEKHSSAIARPISLLYAPANPKRMQKRNKQNINCPDKSADKQAQNRRAQVKMMQSQEHNYNFLRG